MKLIVNGKTTDASLTDSLTRSVIISLFSWARGRDENVAKFGWWGDSITATDYTGSQLWLLLRKKLTDEVLLEAQEYAEEALKWLIDDGICSSVTVEASRDYDRLDLIITLEGNQSSS